MKALVEDLKAALEIAKEESAKYEDTGTCNFDSPVLYTTPAKGPGSRKAKAAFAQAIKDAGLDYFENRGGLVLSIGVGGQARTRTRGAEAFREELARRGYQTTMYYQMD